MRKLTTTELAAVLNIEQAEFVKHRKRYETKLEANGFNFIKEGSRKNITYTFNTEEEISIDSVGNKIKNIFNINTQGRNKLIDKYLRYIALNSENFIKQTDLEVAIALEESRTNVTTVRNIFKDAGYIVLGETHYYKEVEEQWLEIEVDEWNEAWRDNYYPHKEWLDANAIKQQIGDKQFELNSHLAALKYMEEQTGHRYKSIKERMVTFEFLDLLTKYTNSPNLIRPV